MADNWPLVREIAAKIKLLSPSDQLYIAGRILGDIKHDYFTDHAAIAREAEEMANDPDIQRVLRGEDLPEIEKFYPREDLVERKAAS